MISTTLMTFLLITDPNVRSVKLLGSWDNFSKPYAMERDKRVGAGHWRGCHTFTDIIGDGPNDKSQWRTGGLKMGATYWYYYLLDDDLEHYNEAEPVVTNCPLLPGQPMNVLNVPIILPDSRVHGRSGSNSSAKSDYRTMNPEDKFMNPRKPPKPNLARLQTSAPLHHQPGPAFPSSASPSSGGIHRSVSQPNSAARRAHGSKDARSVSPPRSRALQPGFRPTDGADPKKQPDAALQNVPNLPPQQDVPDDRRNVPGIKVNAGYAQPVETSTPATIQSRRALKAGAGDVAPARALTVQTRPERRKPSISRGAAADDTHANQDGGAIPTSTRHEANLSDATTPRGMDTSEKRLPTLPNTPSSVMDEAVREIDETDKAMNAEVLRSHFSSLTTVDDSTNSCLVGEQSRFSEWSTDTDTDYNSPESMVSASTFNHDQTESPAVDDSWRIPDLSSQPTDPAPNTDPNTPHLTLHSKPSSPNSASGDIPSWNESLPQLAVSLSSSNIDASGLGIENMDEVESNPKRHAALFNALESMEALALSRNHNTGSPIILPDVQRESGGEKRESDDQEKKHPSGSRPSDGSVHGQATMQELMDELSYLKNMIQAEMDGAPF